MSFTRLKVIAIDPGVTTGIATGIIKLGEAMEVASMQEKMEVEDMWHFLNDQQPDVIVYETFEYRNRARKGLVLFSRELIGVIRLFGRLHPATVQLHDQSAYEGVGGYFTDKQLKEGNVYKPGNPHAMDATRHLLQWYTFGPGYRYNANGFTPA